MEPSFFLPIRVIGVKRFRAWMHRVLSSAPGRYLLAEYHGGRMTGGQQESLLLCSTPGFVERITLQKKRLPHNLERLGELSSRFRNWLVTRWSTRLPTRASRILAGSRLTFGSVVGYSAKPCEANRRAIISRY